jgi:hypothetical protein
VLPRGYKEVAASLDELYGDIGPICPCHAIIRLLAKSEAIAEQLVEAAIDDGLTREVESELRDDRPVPSERQLVCGEQG